MSRRMKGGWEGGQGLEWDLLGTRRPPFAECLPSPHPEPWGHVCSPGHPSSLHPPVSLVVPSLPGPPACLLMPLSLSLSSTCLCPARSASLARPTLPIRVSAPPSVSAPVLSLPHTRGTLGLSRLWRPLTVWWLSPYRSGWWPSWWPPWWPCRLWPSCGRTSGRCSSSPCR